MISVIICTRNRPELIGDCLRALSLNGYRDSEILVIDQSTGPNTADVVRRFSLDDRIRYLATHTIGLSRARNLGIRMSRGEVVAFTDDDCVPATDWIESLVTSFKHRPEVAAVYGRSLPRESVHSGERPVATKTETRERIFSKRCNPWRLGHGNNMAFRRMVFDTVGLFDEALGPGGILRNGDDADFAYRLLKAGFTVMYDPAPLVYHKQFRHGTDLWHLEKDYDIGAGAMLWKHLKCGDLYALALALDRWSRCGAAYVVHGLLTGKPNHLRLGWYRIFYSLAGMRLASRVAIDVSRQVFVCPTGDREK